MINIGIMINKCAENAHNYFMATYNNDSEKYRIKATISPPNKAYVMITLPEYPCILAYEATRDKITNKVNIIKQIYSKGE